MYIFICIRKNIVNMCDCLIYEVSFSVIRLMHGNFNWMKQIIISAYQNLIDNWIFLVQLLYTYLSFISFNICIFVMN